MNDLSEAFAPFLRRRTRFGGLNLFVEDCLVDIWPLETTWAFRAGLLPSSFENLPKTTFLNVEGVTYEFTGTNGRSRRVFAGPFCEAAALQVLDLNLPSNPFPRLAALRTLVTAVRSGFALSVRLAEFVESNLAELDTGDIERVQLDHYGRILLKASDIVAMIGSIQGFLEGGVGVNDGLRIGGHFQLRLWQEWARAPEILRGGLSSASVRQPDTVIPKSDLVGVK